jgi:hypothetical protein
MVLTYSNAAPDLVSPPTPSPLVIPDVMTLRTLADVRTLLSHLAKATRAKSTWQLVESKLNGAAAGGDLVELFVTLRMVLSLEGVEYRWLERPISSSDKSANSPSQTGRK